MGDDGYQDGALGTYNLVIVTSNLSNAEYSWYKQGYDEGYNRLPNYSANGWKIHFNPLHRQFST